MHIEPNGSTVDTIHRPKRAEDFSRVARIASFAMRWQWVIWIIVTALIAIGFDFRTPSQKFGEVQAEVVANRNETNQRANELERRMNHQEKDMAEVLTILKGLAIDACDRLKANRYARDQLACDKRRE
jgi:hypothetical protein